MTDQSTHDSRPPDAADDAQPAATTATTGHETSVDGTPALVAKRADEPPVETDEIVALAEAAGYAVVGEVTQTRPEQPGSYLGAGKVDTLGERARDMGARLVIVDAALTPAQTQHLVDATPAATRVVDRYRLVLDIFAEQAETKRAQLQSELAQLRYDLPWIERDSDPQRLNIMLEKGTRVDDVRTRIAELERRLEELPDPGQQHRQQRREGGFDLVAIAGYTNAGKSTLLHRLADDLSLDAVDPDHADKDATAAVADRLFETLETTTRRATINGRPVLMTDTVGFIQDLPHWLVASFSETLSESAAADAVVLVVDASDPVDTLREKVAVSLDILDAQGMAPADIVTGLNKMDLLTDDEREHRLEVVSEIAPHPVPLSVTGGQNLDGLTDAIAAQLPTAHADLSMPLCDAAMSVVSWAYDRVTVEDISYTNDSVELTLAGRPELIRDARGKAEAVEPS